MSPTAVKIGRDKPRRVALGLWIAGLLVVLLVGATPAKADPHIAAAGDIACDPASTVFNNGFGEPTGCHQKYTSDLFMDPSTGTLRTELYAVLALGDIQYEDGRYYKYVG